MPDSPPLRGIQRVQRENDAHLPSKQVEEDRRTLSIVDSFVKAEAIGATTRKENDQSIFILSARKFFGDSRGRADSLLSHCQYTSFGPCLQPDR